MLGACGGSPIAGSTAVTDAQPGTNAPVIAVGQLRADPEARDYDFLRPAPYLSIDRGVEMFAFRAAANHAGCENAWQAEPEKKFAADHPCAGEVNRRSYVPNRTKTAALRIVVSGASDAESQTYRLTDGWELKDIAEYAVQPGDIVENQRLQSHEGYFYFNRYCTQDPRPECERVRFRAHRFDPKAEYLVIGRLAADGATIEAYTAEDGTSFFIVAPAASREALLD